MKIDVEPYGWGEAIPGNIAVLLTDVSSHLNRLLAEPVADHINVVHVSRGKRRAEDTLPILGIWPDNHSTHRPGPFVVKVCLSVLPRVLSRTIQLRAIRRWSQQLVSRGALRIGVRIHLAAHGGTMADTAALSKLGRLRECLIRLRR